MLFSDSELKGESLRKTFWLLVTPLLLAGCAGFSPKVNQNFLFPAPAPLSQEFFLLLAERMDPSQPAPSASNGEAKLQSHAEPTRNSNGEFDFCHQDEPPFLIRSGAEESPPTYTPNEQIHFLSALEEEVNTPDSQPPFLEPTVSRPGAVAGIAGLEIPPSKPSRKAKTEKADQDSAVKRIGEKSGKKMEPQDFPGTAVILEAEDRLQEFSPPSDPPSEMETIPPSLPSPEMVAEEIPGGNKSPSNLLAGFQPLLNEKVKEFIDFFQTKADTFFTNSLARSQVYEDMMKRIFREKNLPEELFYLALIESGFNPYALSRAKASGIWQFMTKTGRRFGLKVDKWVDERRDPEKSTYAAAEYLKSLHEMFNCWYLATASYNAGEGKILQAMKKAKSQDFWEISKQRYLKRETKEYVPMFLAAMIIAQDPQKYGFSHVNYHPPLLYEKVAVPPGTRLDRIARAAETDLAEIQALNPSLRTDKTPPDGAPFHIKLPPGKKEIFENNFLRNCKTTPLNVKKHPVRRGDTLAQIAKKNRVSLQELCECNEISPKTLIRPGSTLLIPR